MCGPHRRRATPGASAHASESGREAGTGLIASAAGVIVFLGFLFFAVQLLFNLYATSVVTANAYDAAESVASGTVDHDDPAAVSRARQRAETALWDRLGDYASRVETLDWSASGPETVRLRVLADNPDLLLFTNRLLGFDTVERTITIRVEEFQE